MISRHITRGLLALGAGWVLQSSALAGGLERGGYNIDLLFDPSRFAAESTATFVMPQRKAKNVTDTNPLNGNLNTIPGYSTSADDSESYFSPRVGVKAAIGDAADCMFDYSQPYGAHTNPGAHWAGASDNVETKVNSDNYAVTCSYKFDMGPGQFRVIGGVNYLKMDGFKERLLVPPEAIGFAATGIGRLELEGDGWGWRAGVAYEIPEYALRASLMYYSEVKLNEVTGTVDLTQVPAFVHPLGGLIIPVEGSTSMPEAIELKLQSGIAPDWLAFGSVKWTDWSQLQRIPFYNSGVEITSLDLGYRDGWTVTGGIGHKFNDQWSGAVSVTWDRGTSQEYGTQTDTWLFGAGVSYSPNQNVEIRLGGVIGILTGGDSGPTTIGGVDVGDEATYEFDDDLVAALSTSLKVKF
ncbi:MULTISPECIES: OmpP1/FadL family transporter [Rhizobium/Agrobacterium group]|uniref:OmpP1/FadL family transporter n=2 Tax=Neorhizobium TaxID=1525371 RepID=A0ABV0MBW4_9HYPH|nr:MULTISPECIES: OmpP1/FadL family transporter [Rhizobium/Agrobacterium group]KGD98425.1 long-chain fatty acid transporter [Rhizobium sp. YS-1r]MCC2609805.1 OmpP1/FadL family transporter [Neorhizobium petrolearium]WGI69994.1 OmpP1/FadL family transporter [Neorhizobium petrolearium]